jgi:MFS family permease
MDSVGVLHDSLKEKFKHLGNEFEYYFNLMYAVYSFPNIILPFIGGILITKYGSSIIYLIFALLILIGQIVFSYGIFYNSIYTVLIGRFIFGLGGECLGLHQNSMIVKWFPKSKLGLPLGLAVSGGRIASVLNDLITPSLAAVNYNF